MVWALAASRLAWLRLIGSAVVIAVPRESRTTYRPRDEKSFLSRVHPHSAMPPLRYRRPGFSLRPLRGRSLAIGAALYRWRSAPEPTERGRRDRRSPCRAAS